MRRAIIDNAYTLNTAIGIQILSMVMMELPEELRASAVMESADGSNIDLDIVGEANPALLERLYNLVQTRVSALNQPASATRSQCAPG